MLQKIQLSQWHLLELELHSIFDRPASANIREQYASPQQSSTWWKKTPSKSATDRPSVSTPPPLRARLNEKTQPEKTGRDTDPIEAPPPSPLDTWFPLKLQFTNRPCSHTHTHMHHRLHSVDEIEHKETSHIRERSPQPTVHLLRDRHGCSRTANEPRSGRRDPTGGDRLPRHKSCRFRSVGWAL